MKFLIEIIKMLIESADDYDVSIRTYSGRGMYGTQCLGIVGYQDDILKAIYKSVVEAVRLTHKSDASVDDVLDLVEEGMENFENMSQDSMGRKEILYFTDIEIEKGDDIYKLIEGEDELDDDSESDEE